MHVSGVVCCEHNNEMRVSCFFVHVGDDGKQIKESICLALLIMLHGYYNVHTNNVSHQLTYLEQTLKHIHYLTELQVSFDDIYVQNLIHII